MAAKRLGVLFFIAAIFSSSYSYSQATTSQKLQLAGFNRSIVTSVPFLIMAPDARAGAMGDVGVATSPDANSSHWNSAKLAFIGDDDEDEEKHKRYGFATSYNPWLRKLVGDMSLNYLTGYTKIRKEEALAFNLLYFDLGKIQFTDANNNSLGEGHPNEFSVGGSYSRKLSRKLGVGIGLKFIHSNLANGQQINGTTIKAGNTAAGDIGIYYRTDVIMRRTGQVLNVAFGANISDIGPKISYSNNGSGNFIPTNLRLGTAVTVPLDQYNKIVFALDVNKLMVPSPPIYLLNSKLADSTDANGNKIIEKGKDPNRGWLSGMFGSFSDAPGGLKEELQEFTVQGGVEYWYQSYFAARAGYFHENKNKGYRRYFTVGFGVKYQVFGLDVAYLIPVVQNNPLAESLRFTLSFNFKGKIQQSVTQ
ncbi:MAG TPA: type IX secretion system outer membrane channel protein PorV [Cytophagaceae bacterium]|jgi:hypothetical protein|nr:type IX secretion system outer membrane channel protein PorV [Cytophagaceae bacterium]